jgi:carboxypeptidase Taq
MRAREAYGELVRRSREAAVLSSCAGLLSWDEETYMPPGGVANRGAQMALLAGLLHDRAADPRVGDLLAAVEGSAVTRDPAAAVNVFEWRKAYDRQTRLPRSLLEEAARVTPAAQLAWAEARDRDDFGHFLPWLEQVFALKRAEADCLGGACGPYNALLEDYEPNTTAAGLAALFELLRAELVPLIRAVAGARRAPDSGLLERHYPVERQRLFAEVVAAAVGFDFRRGRMDDTAHPFFCTVGPGDFRIATRFDPRRFVGGLFATLHEVGHVLYEQGLPEADYGTPVGEAPSLGLHESQARLWENAVGRSRAFWEHFFPQVRRFFPEALADTDAEAFYRAVNRAGPSLNRIRADEVTYNLHILIRFELEQALLTGDLPVCDLPAAWNELYRRDLGVSPAGDAEGCLQDSHWSAGLVGYFPTYTLGNLFAAQLYERAEADLGDLPASFARGEFAGLLGWLRERVHAHGSRHTAPALIEGATGSAPDHRPFMRALWRKYGELYGL